MTRTRKRIRIVLCAALASLGALSFHFAFDFRQTGYEFIQFFLGILFMGASAYYAIIPWEKDHIIKGK